MQLWKGFLSLGLNLPILAAFQKIPNNLSKRKRKIPVTDQFMQIVPSDPSGIPNWDVKVLTSYINVYLIIYWPLLLGSERKLVSIIQCVA